MLENRLYIPIIGLVIALCRVFLILLESDRKRWMLFVPMAAIVIACGVGSYLRLPIWQDSETMWNDAIEKAPDEASIYFNLAGYYFDREDYEKTAALMEQYLKLNPEDFLGYSKLRQTYVLAYRNDKAIEVCKRLIARTPSNPHRYIELAKFFEQLTDYDSAKAMYLQAYNIDSTLDELTFDLGFVSDEMKDHADAERYYRKTIQLNPKFYQAYFGLGNAAVAGHRDKEAMDDIEKGLKLGPAPTSILRMLYKLYNDNGMMDQARNFVLRYPQVDQ